VSVQYWSRTSESGTYYDADFRSVETGLGPVVHSLKLRYWSGTSGRSGTYYEADFGLAEIGLGPVVHTLIDAGLMCSPVRIGLISSPVEASYPCSLGLMGSTSHLINE